MRAVVPLDFQRVTALDRRPGIARHNGQAAQRLELRRQRTAFDSHDFEHARYFQRSAVIQRFDLAAIHRRSGNGGEEHAFEMYVSAVDGTAIDDVGAIDSAAAFLADVAEFRRLFEAQAVAGRHCQCTCCCRQLAITQFAPGWLVDHFMQLRTAFAHRDLPLRSGCLFQHGPRGRTAATHRLVPMTHAA